MRNDDPGPRSDPHKERQVLEIFEKYYVPQVVAVIPTNIEDPHVYDKGSIRPLRDNPEVIAIIKEYQQKGLIEIAQHGYTHQTNPSRPSINHDITDDDYYQGIDRRWVSFKPKHKDGYSEFAGLGYEKQYEKVHKGQIYLNDIFQLKFDSFIFPWNTYDQQSLKALKDCGYKYVPAEDDKYNTPDICVIGCCNWDWEIDRFRTLIGEAEKLKQDVFTQFAYHSWEVSEKFMKQLDELLAELSAKKNVVFITPNQIPRETPWLEKIIRLRTHVLNLERKVNKMMNTEFSSPKYYVNNQNHYFFQIIKLSVLYFSAKLIGLFTRSNKKGDVPINKISFGDLKRLRPLDPTFGRMRGKPIDRYYIEKFLKSNAKAIKGHVLEFENDTYTRRYGKAQVTKSDVLHLDEGNPSATLVGDLTKGDFLTDDTFDCIICTQTLMFIYDYKKAMETLCRILKPGGTLLLTVPSIAQICPQDGASWDDYWRFTPASIRTLFLEYFGKQKISIEGYGNVFSAVSLLHGIAVEELSEEELDRYDPQFPLILSVKAKKDE